MLDAAEIRKMQKRAADMTVHQCHLEFYKAQKRWARAMGTIDQHRPHDLMVFWSATIGQKRREAACN